MEDYRDALVRELAELEAQLKEMAGFVGFMGELAPSATIGGSHKVSKRQNCRHKV